MDPWENAMTAVRHLAHKQWDQPPDYLIIGLSNGQIVRLPFRALTDARGDPRPQEDAIREIDRQLTLSHSKDFRVVNWYGEQLKLSKMQAAVFRVLWQAREAGQPDVLEEEICHQADSQGGRLRDLFRRTDIIGRIIVSGEIPQHYRLGEPE